MFPNLLFLMWQLCILKQNNCGLNFENLPAIKFVVFTMKTKKTLTMFTSEFQFWERLRVFFLVIKLFIFNRENIHTFILVRG